MHAASANVVSQNMNLALRQGWAGFDLVSVGSLVPRAYKRDDLFLISGCVTTTTPMANKSGWDVSIANVDPRYCPARNVFFLAPTMMSRYEGIYQCGTSTRLKGDGKVWIYFGKNTNPMVLHLSGICFSVSSEEPIPLRVAEYELRDWSQQPSKLRPDLDDTGRALDPDEADPPALRCTGYIVMLQGSLKEATYGPISQTVGFLPEGYRPLREIRCLATLLGDDTSSDTFFVEHTVAVTLRPTGVITVQGGKVQMVDNKGNLRVLQQKKKGRLCLDGIRFSLLEGQPLQPAPHLMNTEQEENKTAKKTKLGYLMTETKEVATAVVVKQGDVVMLEGHLAWTTNKPPNPKQPLATLPIGFRPHYREVFFTRGSSDLEERRRVDVDKHGRIFCPEGARDGRLELTGVIFVAAEHEAVPGPKEPLWDDLKLQYHKSEANVVSTSFDGHEMLEQFVRRCNYYEWSILEFDFARHSGRKMLLPLGEVYLKGKRTWNDMNLHKKEQELWKLYQEELGRFAITTFHSLLHLSDGLFEQVCEAVKMQPEHRNHLVEKRRVQWAEWSTKRQQNLTFGHLQDMATQIVDQMFEHWDFKAQLQGALQNDHRAPQTIEHLFPQKKFGGDKMVHKKLKPDEMERFEEARQFFYLYETTGSNMTHCSLMGASDVFTTTGKWYFPDNMEVQRELFRHIGWLFPRGIYLYMSERQTSRFPFIEDLDIQCKTDWEGPLAPGEDGSKRTPPDALLMSKPLRNASDEVYGDPGQLMRKRAEAIHMIYPQIKCLEVLVYSASGYNKGKDMLKSSFHLVWPQLMVDPDRAPVIRHVTLAKFKRETNERGSFLNNLQTKLLELHDSNNWELVFDSTTINARNGLRLPYNDKASMKIASEEDKQRVARNELSKTKAPKVRVREDRPSKAVGRITFEFATEPSTGQDYLDKALWTMDSKSQAIEKWIEMGSCRREPSRAELTPWQLGQDVLQMLPTKPGEKFTFEGEDDGEGGHWVTHKPFKQVRRCNLETRDFKVQFTEALSDEQDQLKHEQNNALLAHVVGSFVSVTANQAIWRATAAMQFDGKDPNKSWARDHRYGSGAAKGIQRSAEVIYLKNKGKVLFDGTPRVVEALLRVLKTFTKTDDVAVMPIYDVSKIS